MKRKRFTEAEIVKALKERKQAGSRARSFAAWPRNGVNVNGAYLDDL